MNSKETVMVYTLIEEVTKTSSLNTQFVEQKVNSLLSSAQNGQIEIHELRKAALALLDTLFQEVPQHHN